MNKRGQAALEFLTTYGWAFLVILIMIGALAYFGVLSPSRLLPERCSFSSEFSCIDFRLTGNGDDMDVSITFQNNNEDSLDTVSAAADTDASDVTGTGSCSVTESMPIAPGGDFEVVCTAITGSFPGAGTKMKLPMEINYRTVRGRYNHTVEGEVYGIVN